MDKLILYVIGAFFVIGALDSITGNRLKLGEKFEEGIKTMGALGLGMIGIISLVPIFTDFLSAVIIPICNIFGLDPSIVPAIFLAVDMGGYQMATELAATEEMGAFAGIIIASTLGATISFSIPVALGMLAKEDENYFSKGVLIGILTIPIGCFVAGLWQGIDLKLLVLNLIPIFLFAVILGIGLLKIPHVFIKVFNGFGKLIVCLSIIGLLLQGIDVILGIKLIANLAPLAESTVIVAKIAIVLGGAYPMLAFINRIFKKHFEKVGKRFGINSASVAGILGGLASNLLIFATFKDMNAKGKVVATAFGVSGAFVFGGQLGFVSSVAPDMIGPFIVAKLTAGILSIVLAIWLYDREHKLNKNGGN